MRRDLLKRIPTIVLIGGGSIVAGREIMMLNLARGLRSAGYRVVFVSSLWSGNGEFVSRLSAEKFQFFCIRLGFISKSGGWKPLIWTAAQLAYWPALVLGYIDAIKKSAPDIVIHTNWHHALLLMPFLDCRRDLYWSHEIVGNSRHYRWIFRRIAKNVARMICVSQAVANAMKQLGVLPSKLVVIHNGTWISKVVLPPQTQLPLRLGIVGQIGAWKGHDDVLDALAQVSSGCAVLKIFGVGQSDYVDKLKQKARALKISNFIEWRGFVSNAADIFSEIDICLIMSRSEDPFPTVALEAALCSRPVICSTRGGLTEIVKDRQTGLVVDAERPDRLAAAIKVFVENPGLIAEMGAAAQKHAQSKFSQTRFVRDFIGVIGEVAVR